MARWRPLKRVAQAAEAAKVAAQRGQVTADTATMLLEDVLDGFRLVLVRQPDSGSIMDFVMGKSDRLPIEVQVEVKEPGEKN